MKAIGLSATVSAEGSLTLTGPLDHPLPPGKIARVIVLISDGDEDDAWGRQAIEQFLSVYPAPAEVRH